MTICDEVTITYPKSCGVFVDKFVLICCEKHFSSKFQKVGTSSKVKK